MNKDKFSLKLISLLVAILIFLSVNDSVIGKIFPAVHSNYTTTWVRDIPLEANYDKNKYYILGIPDKIEVKLTGPQAIVQKASLDKNFSARLDFSNINVGEEQNIKVQIIGLDPNISALANPEFINADIRNRISKEFTVKALVSEDRFSLGTILNSVTANDEKVKIYGAEETINNIYEVRAESSDKTKISSDRNEDAQLVAYDRNFNRIEDIQMEKEKTTISIKVNQIEKNLPIKAKEVGSLPSDRSLVSIEIQPTNAIVKAKNKEVLDSVKEVFLDVELSNIKEDRIELSNLKLYANTEDGILLDPSNAKVVIKTQIK